MARGKKSLLIFLVLFVLYFAFQYSKAYVRYLDLQNDLESAQEEYVALEVEELHLQETLQHVETLAYIEKIAREELSLVKEGETLLILIEGNQ